MEAIITVSVETRNILGSVCLLFRSCLYGDFSEVTKSKHDKLTMHRSVEVQLRAFLVSAVCYGEWTAEVTSHGTSPRKIHDTIWI
jgi:hypothetical protein